MIGLRPHDDIEIKVTGLRPGEKLAEALTGPAESSAPSYGDLLHSIEPVALGPDRLSQALATKVDRRTSGTPSNSASSL